MKANARTYFWWPSLDGEIQTKVENCRICAINRPEPKKAQTISVKESSYFFERIHANFLGPLRGKLILIIIDTFSKWPEAFVVNNMQLRAP